MKRWSIDKSISITDICIAVITLIALFLAIQANQLSRLQIEPQPVILDTYPEFGFFGRGGGVDSETVLCAFTFHIVNIGGGVTAFTSYQVEIDYDGQTLKMDSLGTNMASNTQDMISDFSNFYTQIGSQNPFYNTGDFFTPADSSIPIKVDSYADFELSVRTSFSHSNDTSYYFYPYADEGSKPFAYRLTLITSSGNEVTSPKVICTYIRKSTE